MCVYVVLYLDGCTEMFVLPRDGIHSILKHTAHLSRKKCLLCAHACVRVRESMSFCFF